MSIAIVDDASELLERLHHSVQTPTSGGSLARLEAWCLSLCLPWTLRAVESALAVATLRRAGLGHTTQPLNRLVLELSASVHWLLEADDRLAAAAVEAERIRHLISRNTRLVRFGVDEDIAEELQHISSERRAELDELEASLAEDEMAEYGRLKSQFRYFEQLLKGARLDNWYVLYEQTSTDSHRSAEARKRYISLRDDGSFSISPSPEDQVVLALPFVVSLAAAAVRKLQNYCGVFDDGVIEILDEIEAWYEGNGTGISGVAPYLEELQRPGG